MKKFFSYLETSADKSVFLTGSVAAGLIMLLAVFIGIQVFARCILGVHIQGLFELCSYSLIIFTFLSAAYTLRQKRHISVEMLIQFIPEKQKDVLNIAVAIVALAFLVVLMYSGWIWASKSFASSVSTVSEVPVPKGVLISSIVFGAFLLLIQTLRRIAESIGAIRHKTGHAPVKHTRMRDSVALYPVLYIIMLVASLWIAVQFDLMWGICFFTLVLLFSGMPVFMALGLAGCVGLYLLMGKGAFRQIPFFAYQAVNSFPLTCLPLFIIAGVIMENGKVVQRVFSLFEYFSGRFHAAPLVVTILVGGFFCAISGSSVATTSIVAAVALPILIREGYGRSISSGVVAGATIGTVIPPSVGYILYGVITGESIGQLFVAGILPGAIIFGSYCLYVILLGSLKKKSIFEGGKIPNKSQLRKPSLKERGKALKGALWGLFAPVFVLGGIYAGIFTASEAAAVMVLYAILVTVVFMKTLTLKKLWPCVLKGAEISSMILMIIVGARIFGAVTSQLRIAADLVNFANTTGLSPYATLALVSLLLFIFGMFLDSASIMVITLPIFYPLIMSAGFSSLWFGVFFIVMLEIGLLTPPVGLNLFLIYGISGFPLQNVIKGSLPFLLIMLLCLLLFVIFPETVTWLPATMLK